VNSHSFVFSVSRRLKFSYKSILPCTAFPSTLASMLELSPPLPVLLLRVGGLSRLNTRALPIYKPDLMLPAWFFRVRHRCQLSATGFVCDRRGNMKTGCLFSQRHELQSATSLLRFGLSNVFSIYSFRRNRVRQRTRPSASSPPPVPSCAA
jgi:hypothetical protein